MSPSAKVGVALAVVVVTSPMWGFEALYHVFLPANCPQLPRATNATALEMDALWFGADEPPATSQKVTQLWALNYFRVYWPGADARPGVHAVLRLARLWSARAAWPPSVRVQHIRRMMTEMAVMVWLSRTATVDGLKRALAEQTYFGRNAYGIKAARGAYFGCAVSSLTTAQVAFVAGLPQTLGRGDPVAHPDVARVHQQRILKALVGAGVISEADESKAAADNVASSIVSTAAACP